MDTILVYEKTIHSEYLNLKNDQILGINSYADVNMLY